MDDKLKAILTDRPHVQTIYFNSKGEWLFHSHPHFTKEVSRNELLAEDKEEIPAIEVAAQPLESNETPTVSAPLDMPKNKNNNNKKR